MRKALREFAKKVIFRYTRFGAPRYPYNVEPLQLATLVLELERVRNLSGTILEVGVARGMTTRFLCEHLVRSGRTSERVYAIDTFESFNRKDVDFEVAGRGKSKEELAAFGYNDFDTWRKNFSEFPFVVPVKADCSTFDYRSIGPIKLAFLDVDLYRPTKEALKGIMDQLCEGGVVLVDDVKPDRYNWDGAYQAYMEFCSENKVEPEVVGEKCGLIRREPHRPALPTSFLATMLPGSTM
jgi:predicted O-methyltransferase YrrM